MTNNFKRPSFIGLSVLLGITSFTALTVPARAQSFPTFRLVASHSGKALIAEPSVGAAVTQQASIGGPNDVWFFNNNGQLVHNKSGLCMQPESSASGARIRLQKCFTGDPTSPNQPPQFWTLRLTPINGQRLARYQNKITNLLIDVSGASTNNGAAVVQFNVTGGQNQAFERRFL